MVEQFLDSMPRDLRIWIHGRKPAMGEEAGKLADDYIYSRQQESWGLS